MSGELLLAPAGSAGVSPAGTSTGHARAGGTPALPAWEVLTGDCLHVLATLPAGCVDAVVTDPPYGLTSGSGKVGFMGLAWDRGVPGVEYWQAVRRVCRPGAHLLAFGGTRVFHRLACALEDAGWELRDTLCWLYGQGFPKSLDVGKAIDRAAGAKREVVGPRCLPDGTPHQFNIGYGEHNFQSRPTDAVRTAAATAAARAWAGWGTALKPAWEPILLARAPLDGTVAANVLCHGTGGINVDGCRIGAGAKRWEHPRGGIWATDAAAKAGLVESALGRWPANVCHDGSREVLAGLPASGMRQHAVRRMTRHATYAGLSGGAFAQRPGSRPGYVDRGDTGSAARFFYCAKASRRDRDAGCEAFAVGQTVGGGGGIGKYLADTAAAAGKYGSEKAPHRNLHPTVKPTALMRWLCRLVTPPGGLVLDPFAGSGSTGKAALLEGFCVVLIEREPQYAEIARARCAWAAGQVGRTARAPAAAESGAVASSDGDEPA